MSSLPLSQQALATTLVQITISIAGIAVLTRERWLFWMSAAAAFGGALG